jgi:hypothetical protein
MKKGPPAPALLKKVIKVLEVSEVDTANLIQLSRAWPKITAFEVKKTSVCSGKRCLAVTTNLSLPLEEGAVSRPSPGASASLSKRRVPSARIGCGNVNVSAVWIICALMVMRRYSLEP